MKPRVRFAPSPTGHLHIGGARTALFNWLFARHTGGTFVLRIEDTDVERSTKEFEQSILDGMTWLGLDWDGELVYQSQRLELYKQHVQKLLDCGHAYRCTCTPEELEAKRAAATAAKQKPKYDGTCRNRPADPSKPAAIRFKAPQEGTTTFHDLCRGTISFENTELDDLIIARSDGTPTYNFTVVVDDVTMQMTHIIRGDDHINNTPRQVLLYQALGYPVPEFAHLPMIYGPDKKKLSKRHGATSVFEFKDMGFLPDAMLNYLARLGWAHGDQEIFTRDELIQHFDLYKVHSAPAIFDMEKLRWVNSQHLAKKSIEEIVEGTRPFLEARGLTITDTAYAAKAIGSERERGRTFVELADASEFYFRDDVNFDDASVQKWLNADGKVLLQKIRDRLAPLESFTEASIAEIFKALVAETGLKMVNLAQPIRVALTGTTVSPGVYLVLSILGKDRALKRIDRALTLAT
ncbi:MAG: glutamate--tRNA ligase [Deltaproteobacteria bacterium]|nr:glutamate--tRNA ligase [Deltaproteobacteria bacterium]